MTGRRWWDAVIPGFTVVIAAIAVLFQGDPDQRDVVVVALSSVLFVGSYFALGRGLLSSTSHGRAALFCGGLCVALVVGIAAAPFFAILQTLAYPLVWVTTRSRVGGALGSAAIGLAVVSGFAVGGGFTTAALASGFASGGLSVVFAIAMGLWITSITEYGAERARLVAELTEAQSAVAALNHDRGIAAERERIARDIHDTLAQTLAGLVLLSELSSRHIRDGKADAAAKTIETVERTAREALNESRALVARMAAVPSDDALAAAIERLAERFRTEVGLTIDVSVDAGAALPRDGQVVLLRCLQEALANVRKHAQATLVTVSLTSDDDEIVMSVYDDGVGFDSSRARTGFGLDGIVDRVALAGGAVAIDSTSGSGTQLNVRVPKQ
ncbi:signal transduction histidine kinase [Microbacterium halimionae]|uniref:Oxygen sensor histidine kinase NreB n=1 Tax=Microbacterium halimionae TaxID=1526413 RepID=A0A7W3PKZ3_9MICO|nr:sensor histidine kinase [Microbacterium halimionae]MBA8815382.1 signal transduction histidine kinase [Microbacterium halimionae]NII95429.1 signal transduction histidine kinase [Microbacterium halimionae]